VFIGGSDVDPWVAHDLLSDTASELEKMDGRVDFRTYPGMAHTVNQDEIDRVRAMFADVLQNRAEDKKQASAFNRSG
jgi:predicted esterase